MMTAKVVSYWTWTKGFLSSSQSGAVGLNSTGNRSQKLIGRLPPFSSTKFCKLLLTKILQLSDSQAQIGSRTRDHCIANISPYTVHHHATPLSLSLTLSTLTAICPGELGLAGFITAKDDGSGGDNWSGESCKAPVKSSPPTNQHPTFYRPEALPVTQPTVVSEHWILLKVAT